MKLGTFLSPQSLYEVRLKIFLSPRAQKKARAWNFSQSHGPYKRGRNQNFSKSQGPYRYGRAKSNISTYFLIFLYIFDIFFRIFYIFLHISSYIVIFPSYSYILSTYFFIYLHISFLFLHIFDIFLHIPSYLLDQGIPECDVIRKGGGGGVYSQILKLPPRSRAGNFSKSPGHFFEFDVIRVGVEGGVLANPDIT